MDAQVTVIVATYNRPEPLRAAIRAVIRQTVSSWRLLVVGDCCDGRTAAVIEECGDPRIHYVNLPERCGEQALPNSVGMSLAETPFVALLNHDDLWISDHLEQALAALNAGVEFYCGLTAFGARTFDDPRWGNRLRFSNINAADRRLIDAFHSSFALYEPCSAWVFRRQLIERVGGWRSSRELYRTPLQDWVLRAARADVVAANGKLVTSIKVNVHSQQPAGRTLYESPVDVYGALDNVLGQLTPEQVRRLISEDLNMASASGQRQRNFRDLFDSSHPTDEQRWLAARLLNHDMAEVFLRTGWDAFDVYAQFTGRQRGALLRQLPRRTGEQPAPETPDIERLVAYARRHLRGQIEGT